MTPLKCDLCGSNDVVKDGEYFVCQYCGTKYTIETAKQMMFGGTVKVDSSDQVQNYLTLAKRAASEGGDPREYISKALELSPDNPEAFALDTQLLRETCLAEVKQLGRYNSVIWTKADSDLSIEHKRRTRLLNREKEENKRKSADQLFSVLKNSVVEAYEEFAQTGFVKTCDGETTSRVSASDVEDAINSITKKELAYWESVGIDEKAIADLKEIIAEATYKWCESVCKPVYYLKGWAESRQRDEMVSLLLKIHTLTQSVYLKKDVNELIIKYVDMYPRYVKGVDGLLPVSDSVLAENRQLVKKAQDRISELDPSYVKPKEEKAHSNGFCYVATAVYGSYDCPEVWTLRRFRDYDLAETWYGRAFIRTYYAVSPTIVKWFGKTEWFSNIWRPVLDRMVASLKEKGYKDTPYDDRQW